MTPRRIETKGSETSPFWLFLAGAAVGAAVALLTTRESGEDRRHHIDDWLTDHGLGSEGLLRKVKNLLHVRKNGHVVNGHKQGGRRHGQSA